jgi:hypothetical protein
MGFRQGAYAKIWEVDDETGYKYATCQMSVSRKDKDSGEYKTEFQDGYVRLIGNAYDAIEEYLEENDIPERGLSVKISSCDVTNNYDKKKEKLYVNYAVFGMKIADEDGNFPDDDEDDGSSKKKSAKGKKSSASKGKKSTSSSKGRGNKKAKEEEPEDIISDLDDDEGLPF